MTTEDPLNPESLVARIIRELQENPEAQTLLLRALLTNEFLGMPARLARLEGMVEQLQIDVSVLKTDVGDLKTDVAGLKTDVGDLKGRVMETSLYNFAFGVLTVQLSLRRVQIVRGTPMTTMPRDFDDAIAENGLSSAERGRILTTDLIMRGVRTRTGETVYVAAEASYTLDQNDVARAKESAENLARVFPGATVVPAVYGAVIPPQVRRAAEEGGVLVFQE